MDFSPILKGNPFDSLSASLTHFLKENSNSELQQEAEFSLSFSFRRLGKGQQKEHKAASQILQLFCPPPSMLETSPCRRQEPRSMGVMRDWHFGGRMGE